jgi:hypothetical protein
MDVKPLPAERQGTNPVGSAIPFRSPHQKGKLRIPNDSITTIYLSTKPAEDQDIFDLYIKDETNAIGQLRWTSIFKLDIDLEMRSDAFRRHLEGRGKSQETVSYMDWTILLATKIDCAVSPAEHPTYIKDESGRHSVNSGGRQLDSKLDLRNGGCAKGCGIDEHNDLGDAIDYQDGLRRLTSRAGILTTPL